MLAPLNFNPKSAKLATSDQMRMDSEPISKRFNLACGIGYSFFYLSRGFIVFPTNNVHDLKYFHYDPKALLWFIFSCAHDCSIPYEFTQYSSLVTSLLS